MDFLFKKKQDKEILEQLELIRKFIRHRVLKFIQSQIFKIYFARKPSPSQRHINGSFFTLTFCHMNFESFCLIFSFICLFWSFCIVLLSHFLIEELKNDKERFCFFDNSKYQPKQLFADVLQKRCSEKFRCIYRKRTVLEQYIYKIVIPARMMLKTY